MARHMGGDMGTKERDDDVFVMGNLYGFGRMLRSRPWYSNA